MPRVTALRDARRGRVAVELDGSAWRTLPAEVVVRAGLSMGRELDRGGLRVVRRELRRSEALDVATRALASRDQSAARLRSRLDRHRISAATREEALAALERSGLVDDARFASLRAAALALRGYGDAAIADDLERQGIEQSVRDEALAGLEPETERARAVVKRRGGGSRTARYLAARGFEGEAVAAACGRAFAPDP